MNLLINDLGLKMIEQTIGKLVLAASSKGFVVERFSDSRWKQTGVYRGRLVCRSASFDEAALICHITITRSSCFVSWVLETEVFPGHFENIPGFNMRKNLEDALRDFEIAKNFKKEGYYIEYARQLGVI